MLGHFGVQNGDKCHIKARTHDVHIRCLPQQLCWGQTKNPLFFLKLRGFFGVHLSLSGFFSRERLRSVPFKNLLWYLFAYHRYLIIIIIISSSSHHHLIIISSSSHHHLIIISSSSHHHPIIISSSSSSSSLSLFLLPFSSLLLSLSLFLLSFSSPPLSLSCSSFSSIFSAQQWHRKSCPSNPLRESGC